MTAFVHHDLTHGRTIVRRGPAASTAPRERFAWAEVSGAVPHVSEATRRRIVRIKAETGKLAREVHATIRGEVTATGEGARDVSGLRRITYNPFHPSGVFRWSDTDAEWTGGGRVLVTGGYAYALDD